MRYERFHTLVGFFIVGAFVLATAASVFFYKQHLHAQVQTFVMQFKGSLKGLVAGSPVTYRGVKIGQITLIEITENEAGNKVEIPVYVEFFVEKNLSFTKNPVQLLINRGYKAAISKPNYLTGVADIELVKSDNSTKNYRQSYFRNYPVFPTQPALDDFISVDTVLKTADTMFQDISRLVRSKNIDDTLKAARVMASSLHNLADTLDTNVPLSIASINRSLNKFSDAAESTKDLADYLARYPESLLRGKK